MKLRPFAWAAAAGGLAALSAGAAIAAPATCSARGAAPVIELYTSEGCNSCPPADRWLSSLKAQPGVVALAFHVDYWDRLGWKDRFASAAFTRRQTEQREVNGARFIYTPQVVVNGEDRKDWPSLQAPPGPLRDRLALDLSRDGERFSASVEARPGAPARLAAYWAVTEQDHRSDVKAGENQGVTLHHDFVVRELRPVAAWNPEAGKPMRLEYQPSMAADPAHPRQVNLVVFDAANGKPLGAVKLGC